MVVHDFKYFSVHTFQNPMWGRSEKCLDKTTVISILRSASFVNKAIKTRHYHPGSARVNSDRNPEASSNSMSAGFPDPRERPKDDL
jgi:hypothetical protein